jgi:nucleoside-diphosphate-sugar epimerase
LKLGDLSPIRDFNYVENTVEAFIHLMFADDINYGEAYNAGSGSTITIGDTVKLIEKNVGIKKQIISDERKSRPSKSEVFELIADYSKFNKATGWEPKITFEQGISRTIEWYLQAEIQKDPKTEKPDFD